MMTPSALQQWLCPDRGLGERKTWSDSSLCDRPVFYGRGPCSAGHTGIMTMDEARQVAIDFAKLPELLKQNVDAE